MTRFHSRDDLLLDVGLQPEGQVQGGAGVLGPEKRRRRRVQAESDVRQVDAEDCQIIEEIIT